MSVTDITVELSDEQLSGFKTHHELIEEQLQSDPEFRAEWERTAVARAVAIEVIRYRNDHGLSQTALADLLGVKQPQVSRLEGGDVNPSVETLVRLASRLGMEFTLDIHPAGKEPKHVTKRAQQRAQARYENPEVGVMFAAAG
jgi:transcriptional regulator with XRE-family HTH domain